MISVSLAESSAEQLTECHCQRSGWLLETLRQRWRREKALLLAKIRSLGQRTIAATRLQQSGTLSDRQVWRLATGKRLHWTAKDVGKAARLRGISHKANYQLSLRPAGSELSDALHQHVVSVVRGALA